MISLAHTCGATRCDQHCVRQRTATHELRLFSTFTVSMIVCCRTGTCSRRRCRWIPRHWRCSCPKRCPCFTKNFSRSRGSAPCCALSPGGVCTCATTRPCITRIGRPARRRRWRMWRARGTTFGPTSEWRLRGARSCTLSARAPCARSQARRRAANAMAHHLHFFV